ncbi:MAG: ATP-binding cassette domain-containing protein [Verrucomicrobia bacterium]|nr:ATP-binding cassette domain-containing protein [Verrucomicrobiota bacterium]
MIEARALSKQFRDSRKTVIAVDQVSFQVRPGEIYGLLGANGAGKTTTMRMLATMLRPTGGAASICGHDVATDREAARRSLGFLSTATALYNRLTAFEMVQYFGRLHGLDDAEIRTRAQRIFERLDMGEFRDRRCEKLSTGQKQKVSIARTLIHDPPVMIFDEPTLGLDVMAARTIVEFVRECRAAGKAVIYSTHIMSEAEKLCNRLGIIHGGRLLAEGTPAALRAEHAPQGDLEDAFVRVVESFRATPAAA